MYLITIRSAIVQLQPANLGLWPRNRVQPSTFNLQPSTFNLQPSTCQPSTCQPWPIGHATRTNLIIHISYFRLYSEDFI
ncbi:hypothetical protein [Moorena sp. SIOASIH]|uniref:hypothetical protein n=1 Tax=Moorena sp. SIOASIH TaxID=2607817 RepID=UPI0025E3B72E|nr:hypothetical protein [Moorena sp. SIOASIH]